MLKDNKANGQRMESKFRGKVPHIKEGRRESRRKSKRGRRQGRQRRQGGQASLDQGQGQGQGRQGRQASPNQTGRRRFKLRWNPLFDCRRPNAEILVRQLYEVCEKDGVCVDRIDPKNIEERKVWKSVNAIFSRFSYVSPPLRNYIWKKEFRKDYMFDGKKLTKNTNEYRLLSPTHSQQRSYYESFGLSNIDGKFPDAFARTESDACPQVPQTIFNCFGKCRRDNCNENPPRRKDIDVSDRVPNILSMPLNKFINADFKDFVDPFKGQLGYLFDENGAVKNVDGTWSFYKSPTLSANLLVFPTDSSVAKLVRYTLARVSSWDGKDLWDGVGMDPYRQMGEHFKI